MFIFCLCPIDRRPFSSPSLFLIVFRLNVFNLTKAFLLDSHTSWIICFFSFVHAFIRIIIAFTTSPSHFLSHFVCSFLLPCVFITSNVRQTHKKIIIRLFLLLTIFSVSLRFCLFISVNRNTKLLHTAIMKCQKEYKKAPATTRNESTITKCGGMPRSYVRFSDIPILLSALAFQCVFAFDWQLAYSHIFMCVAALLEKKQTKQLGNRESTHQSISKIICKKNTRRNRDRDPCANTAKRKTYTH